MSMTEEVRREAVETARNIIGWSNGDPKTANDAQIERYMERFVKYVLESSRK